MKKMIGLGGLLVCSIAVLAGGNPEFVGYPADYKDTFTLYHNQNRANNKQVADFYANETAIKSLDADGELADGSIIVMEVYKPETDADGKPVTGNDGIFKKAGLAAVAVMEKRSNWDESFSSDARTGNWGYAIYDAGGMPKDNDLDCVSCHKPLSDQEFMFTFPRLGAE